MLIKPLAEARPAMAVLEDLLPCPARGLTNVGFALDVAAAELGRSRARRRSAILLRRRAQRRAGSAPGRPPLPAAATCCCETGGEHDGELAADLARLGHGRVFPVRNHRDVAPALNRALVR